MSESRICRAFQRFPETLCFIGHTHDLGLIHVTAATASHLPFAKGRSLLTPGDRYLINVGAVGQPRDGDSHAKYVIWDASEPSVEVRYVPYDIEAAAKKILEAGYPEYFAERLR